MRQLHLTYLAAAAANATSCSIALVVCGSSEKPFSSFVRCSSSNHILAMASRRFGLSVAISMLEIPLPEEDDMSDDEFDGYVDPDEAPFDSEVGYDGEESEADDDVPSIPDFRQPTGPSLDMSNKTPLDFFKLLVTEDMLDGTVEQTNLYAQQFMDATSLPPHSRVHGWNNEAHTRVELKKLLAMIITMGLVNFLHIEDYWATFWPYSTTTFSKVYIYTDTALYIHIMYTCRFTCTMSCI